jgi:hypothetical protein
MTMFAEPLLAGGEERYGEREYQQQQHQQQQQQYTAHLEKGATARPYQEADSEDREVNSADLLGGGGGVSAACVTS